MGIYVSLAEKRKELNTLDGFLFYSVSHFACWLAGWMVGGLFLLWTGMGWGHIWNNRTEW
jgi:hypothetical protein